MFSTGGVSLCFFFLLLFFTFKVFIVSRIVWYIIYGLLDYLQFLCCLLLLDKQVKNGKEGGGPFFSKKYFAT